MIETVVSHASYEAIFTSFVRANTAYNMGYRVCRNRAFGHAIDIPVWACIIRMVYLSEFLFFLKRKSVTS